MDRLDLEKFSHDNFDFLNGKIAYKFHSLEDCAEFMVYIEQYLNTEYVYLTNIIYNDNRPIVLINGCLTFTLDMSYIYYISSNKYKVELI